MFRKLTKLNENFKVSNIQVRKDSCGGKSVLAKRWVLVKAFDGEAKLTNFKLCTLQLPGIQTGEILCKACFISVDPYMRAYAHNYLINDTMPGAQVAVVVDSKTSHYKKGDIVLGNFGWRTATVVNPKRTPCPHLADFEGLPISLGLGALGFTGNTAYFGVTEILKPKKKHTVVVSAAAGAVGSHVAQLCKLKGCTVIGICGTDQKCQFLMDELCLDGAINYKTDDIRDKLNDISCSGIDMYWDNVGGCISSQVINQMKNFGKVVVCGAISCYNCPFNFPPSSPTLQNYIYCKQLSIQGFLVNSFISKWDDGIYKNLELVKEGHVICREWINEGFNKLPSTFIGMMKGDNIGKSLVKIEEDEKEEEDCMARGRTSKEGESVSCCQPQPIK